MLLTTRTTTPEELLVYQKYFAPDFEFFLNFIDKFMIVRRGSSI